MKLQVEIADRQNQLDAGVYLQADRDVSMNRRMLVASTELNRLSTTQSMMTETGRYPACQLLLLPKTVPKAGLAGWKQVLFSAMTTCPIEIYQQALGICARTRQNRERNILLRGLFNISMDVRVSHDVSSIIRGLYTHA